MTTTGRAAAPGARADARPGRRSAADAAAGRRRGRATRRGRGRRARGRAAALHVRRPGPAGRPRGRARRSSSSSAGARRSAIVLGPRDRGRRPASGQADRRPGPGRRAAPAAAQPGARRAGSPTHYLAPPAVVLRAMLPPGILERLELVAELARRGASGREAPTVDRRPGRIGALLDQLGRRAARGPRPRRARGPGRPASAGCGRSPRSGSVDLDWTLLAAPGGPRYERWVVPTIAGRAAQATLARGGRLTGPPARAAPGRACSPSSPPAPAGAAGGGARRTPRDVGAGRPRPPRPGRRSRSASGRAGRSAHRPAGRRGGRPAAADADRTAGRGGRG